MLPIFDSTMLLLIPAFILAIFAQSKVKSAYRKWSNVPNKKGITGAQLANEILSTSGLSGIKINPVGGRLTDNYNPINKTLNLSEGIYDGDSVASLGISAHESGHAIQHQKSYLALSFRNGIFPVARFGSWLAYPMFIIGIFSGSKVLIDMAIYLFVGFVAFTVITLPVEFNASSRALKILKSGYYLTESELTGAREVLNAAALTYVASAAMAIVNLLRLLLIRGRD